VECDLSLGNTWCNEPLKMRTNLIP